MNQPDDSLRLAGLIAALDRIERRRGKLALLSRRIRSRAGRILYARYYGPSPWVGGEAGER